MYYSRNSDQTWEKVNCTDIMKPECEFESIKDFYGITLRVRAEESNLKSEWTETRRPFVALEDSMFHLLLVIY